MRTYLISLIMFGVVFSFDSLGEAKAGLTLVEIDKISSQIPALKDPLQRLLKNDSTLIELNLFNNQIGDQETEYLAKALQSNSSLKELNLSASDIGAQGAKYLAKALHFNSSLKELNLSANDIGAQGAKYLAKALPFNSSLVKLILGGSVFGIRIGSGIGDQGAEAIGKALASNSALTQLYLSLNQIGDQGAVEIAKALQSNSCLQQLNLSSNQIGPQGAEHLAKALKANSCLQELYLGFNEIGDQGAEVIGKALAINSALARLDLGGNQIGDQGAVEIAKALQTNSALTQLSLSYNQIGDQGAEAIGKALASNSALTQLYLSSNKIKSELIIQIDKLLSRNQELAKNKQASKPAEHLKALSNNNNNDQLVKNLPPLVASFIEAHKQSQESTKEFASKCLMSLYTANKVSEVYKNDSAYQLLTAQYQKALGTQEPKIIEFVKETISEQCNQSPLFESLVDIYFGSIKNADQPYTIVVEHLVKIHKQSVEATKGFSKECLIPLYISGKVPESYKQDPIYQLLSQQYQKAVHNKDTTMMKSLEQLILEQCNKLPLFESLAEIYFFSAPNHG